MCSLSQSSLSSAHSSISGNCKKKKKKKNQNKKNVLETNGKTEYSISVLEHKRIKKKQKKKTTYLYICHQQDENHLNNGCSFLVLFQCSHHILNHILEKKGKHFFVVLYDCYNSQVTVINNCQG